MIDPNIPLESVVGATFLCALGLVLKYRPWDSKKESNGASGGKSVDFWKTEIRDSVLASVQMAVLPILSNQTDILQEMKELLKDQGLALVALKVLLESRERRGE